MADALPLTANDLEALRRDLLDDWNKAGSSAPVVLKGTAVAQALPVSPAPRPGLSVALGAEPKTGSAWLELRVPPGDREGEIGEEVRALQRRGKEAGADIRVRVLPRPTVSVIKPTGRAQNAALAQDGGSGLLHVKFPSSCRPPHIGCSIGHEEGASGTLATFIRFSDGKDRVGALSCCHVLALCGHAEAGDHIYQPGRSDKDPLFAADRLGKLSDKFAPFGKASSNLDAAVVTLAPEIRWANSLPDLPDIPQQYRNQPLGSVLPIAELEPGTEVGRVGRTTGFATGLVLPTSVDGQEVVFDGPRAGIYKFSGVIEINWDPPTNPGDSGCLVFRLSDLRPVALHFAGIVDPPNDPIGLAQPLDRVLTQYKLVLA